MKQVGISEAKNQRSGLLGLVEQGETVLITRHGKLVARLVPAEEHRRDRDAALAAKRIRDRAKALNLNPFDWAAWRTFRDEGRQ
jgi:prevent-host-death family protein